MTIRDRDDRLIYANDAALAHLGFASVEELRATSPDEIFAGYRVFGERAGHRDGRHPVGADPFRPPGRPC